MDETAQEQFFYDEFFSDEDDPGVEVRVSLRGREVPFRIRRGIPLAEKLGVQAKAIKRHLDSKTGRVVIDGIDEAQAAVELLAVMLLEWPFVKRDGSPVKITRDNIKKLIGAEKLVEVASQIEAQGDAALAPFAAASDEA